MADIAQMMVENKKYRNLSGGQRAEEDIAAAKSPPEKKKKKSTFWRLAKMAIMGSHYKEPKDS